MVKLIPLVGSANESAFLLKATDIVFLVYLKYNHYQPLTAGTVMIHLFSYNSSSTLWQLLSVCLTGPVTEYTDADF